MPYLLGVIVFLWCIFVYAKLHPSKDPTDFLGEFMLLVIASLAAILSLAYVFAVLWFHRFV